MRNHAMLCPKQNKLITELSIVIIEPKTRSISMKPENAMSLDDQISYPC